MADLIGKRLGQYLITGKLGEGGMATVYRARQESMNRDVAIKIIESKLASNPDFVRRFQREAQMVASFSNSQILKVFDYGQEGDMVYLVMELLPGGNLADLIRAQTLPLDRAARLLDQIASALDYAHQKGIIHRDLKPQNVMLDDNGNAILTDFGIAKMLESNATMLTQEGAVVGTPAYMAPEQWQGKPVDARSDIYALGIMLYEMLTGQVAFTSNTPASMMFKHLQEPPPMASHKREELSAAVDAVIAQALAKEPDDRFQSAGALAQAFRQALSKPSMDRTMAEVPPSSIGTPVKTASGRSTNVSTPQPTPLTGWLKPGADPLTLIDVNPPAAASGRSRTGLIVLGVVAVLVIIGGLAVFALSQNQQASAASSTAARIQAIALQQTESIGQTASAQPTVTQTPLPASATLPATLTTAPIIPVIVPTETRAPTQTATLTATATLTSTPSHTATPLPPSPTPGLQTIVALTFEGRQTATANAIASFTKTSTVTPTMPAEQKTAAALIAATDTAVVVAAYSKTPTATPSFTVTPTFTATATLRPTLTFTPLPSATNTLIPSNTPVPSQTPSQTAVPTLAPTFTRTPGPTPKLGSFRIDTHGVEQVWAPAGCFLMGSDPQKDPQAQAPEQPAHDVCITRGYWLDRYEVTNAAYQRFIDEDGYTRRELWSEAGWAWRVKNSRTGPDSYGDFLDPNQPRVGITWFEAEAYARWRGGRLPTEAEWEYAARGPKGLIFPWGNKWDPSRANYGNTVEHTEPVNKFTNGQSWLFTFNMVGNAWEWCADWFDAKYYAQSPKNDPPGPSQGTERCQRGGSFDNDPSLLRGALRNKSDPTFQFSAVGVRIASDGLAP